MLFIKETEVRNFADDTTINYEEAHRKLSNDTHILLNWCRINSMVADPRKFQGSRLLGSLINNNNITFTVENKHIKSTNKVKLVGITTDDKFAFTKHINNLSSTISNRLRALTRRRKFLSKEQTKLLSQAYIMSTFKYCPLASMFCGKFEKKCFNKIYKHTLRLIALSD